MSTGDAVQVDVRREGRRFEAEALIRVDADAATVWDTITDYPTLHRFMPGIRACRVLSRNDTADGHEHLVVEQRGEFRFLLFAQAMTVVLEIDQHPHQVAFARAVSFELGVFKRQVIDVFEGRYEIEVLGSRKTPRVNLHYHASIGLRVPPPPAIGSVAVRQNLSAQLEAIASEIARRRSSTSPARR